MSRIDDIAIIDAHHHLWDLDHLNYPSLSGPPRTDFFLGDNTPIRRNYLPEDYRKDSAKHNVIGTVHCEAECHRDFQVQESEWIMAMNARYGFPNAIVGRDPVDAGHPFETGYGIVERDDDARRSRHDAG
jgi:predicted TIM-barrel fold metal-dependent hydrolase